MSPLHLRRHRAERMLREQFHELRTHVLDRVRARLRAGGVPLAELDLDAAYAQAWQGLYMVLLDGGEVASPVGWLVLVTHRRALDEHRSRTRARCAFELAARSAADGSRGAPAHARDGAVADVALLAHDGAAERDLAQELDDRTRLRQLFEGLRGRLEPREREAAALCYLHGMTRAQAAAHMGIGEKRMRKLMEGRGPGRPGVAAKVGALVHVIREDAWCEQQGSLMRAFAYGILDPDGERHRLALLHSDACPRCRAYVASLRGLAAVLPPVLLPKAACAALLARIGEGLRAGATPAGSAAATGGGGAGATGAGAAGAGGGAAAAGTALGAAGAGAGAGGGWLLGAGSLGAKLAAGCVLALTVGAGCLALEGQRPATVPHRTRRVAVHASRQPQLARAPRYGHDLLAGVAPVQARARLATTAVATRAAAPLSAAARASREFGPEQAAGRESGAQSAPGASTSASAASSATQAAQAAASPAPAVAADTGDRPPAARAGDSTAAEREFSPG